MESSLTPTWTQPSDRHKAISADAVKPHPAPSAHADVSHGDDHGTRQSAKRPGIGWVFLALFFVLGLAGLLFYVGWKPSELRHAALAAAADEARNAPMRVVVTTPKHSDAINKLMLPGEIRAERETIIYARASGYLQSWAKDIGDRVKVGEVLAVIDSPEVDMQLLQSRAALLQSEAMLSQSQVALEHAKAQHEQAVAQLGTAKANSDLTEITRSRYVSLRNSGGMPEQLISEKIAEDNSAKASLLAAEAAVKTAHAAVASAGATIGVDKANVEVAKVAVKRLEVLQKFETVTAPFDGIVTDRLKEVGSLVMAGSASNGEALFHIAATETVRVYVDVPQSAAPAIKVGQSVQLFLREFPDAKFSGDVARTTRAIDPSSRTLRTEVRVKNPDGKLLAGMYARVTLGVNQTAPPLLLPGSALIVNANGTQVAVVRDGHVHFQPVVVEADYGSNVGISSGLKDSDAIVANPSERLHEGVEVTASQAAQ